MRSRAPSPAEAPAPTEAVPREEAVAVGATPADAAPLPEAPLTPLGWLVVKWPLARRGEMVLGFNASGLHLHQRSAWEREISAMVREYFEHQRATAGESPVEEAGEAASEAPAAAESPVVEAQPEAPVVVPLLSRAVSS